MKGEFIDFLEFINSFDKSSCDVSELFERGDFYASAVKSSSVFRMGRLYSECESKFYRVDQYIFYGELAPTKIPVTAAFYDFSETDILKILTFHMDHIQLETILISPELGEKGVHVKEEIFRSRTYRYSFYHYYIGSKRVLQETFRDSCKKIKTNYGKINYFFKESGNAEIDEILNQFFFRTESGIIFLDIPSETV